VTKPAATGPPAEPSVDNRPARWFLFAWVSLVYLVGWLASGRIHLGHLAVVEINGATTVVPGANQGVYQQLPEHPTALFAAAMIAAYALHAVALTDRWPPRARWAYFPLQAGLLAVIGANTLDAGLVIGLTLALSAEAPVLLHRPRSVLCAIACCGLGSATSLAWHEPATVVWNTTDYLSMIMFVVGGALLLVLQRQAHARQRRLNAELTAASARIEELTREAERRRIARDLHDTLSQGLVGVTMQLQAAIAHLDGERAPAALPILHRAVLRAQATLGEARAAIHDLRDKPDDPADTGPDLRSAIQGAIDRFESVLACPVDLHVDAISEQTGPGSATRNLSGQLPLIVRVVEEALANIARHAQARHASVTVHQKGTEITVEVRDDGIGFDPERSGGTRGFGLLGMAERAELAEGALDVETAPGHGTLIRLRLPLGAARAPRRDAPADIEAAPLP
jgi:NarL family two-component system sensor histidine kinase YdfH